MTPLYKTDQDSVRRLQGALQQYRRVTQRSDIYIVNKALRNVAMRAVRHTRQADRGQLARKLGASIIPLARGRSRRYNYKPTTVAYAMFIGECKRLGRPIPKGPMLAAAVVIFTRNKLRSVAFMRAGWVPSINALSRLTRESAGDVRSLLGGKKGFGGSVAARAIGSFVAGEIYNASISHKSPTSAWALATYAGPALDIAIGEEAADKWDYAQKQLDKNADDFNR
jgi:hypothetical protein